MKPIPFLLCTFSILFIARAEPPEPPLSLRTITTNVLTNNSSPVVVADLHLFSK